MEPAGPPSSPWKSPASIGPSSPPPYVQPPVPVPESASSTSLPAESTTSWRRRRRGIESVEETDDDTRSIDSSHRWQPDAADVEMMTGLSIVEPVGRLKLDSTRRPRAKRMKVVDLDGYPLAGGSGGAGPSGSDSMFTELNMLAPADEHIGNALLCFLNPSTFVGFVELQHDGERHVLKLNGSESLTECDRALCSVQDCCGDKAFIVAAQSSRAGSRKRTFLARSLGVGDYVAFEGRGLRFSTDFVPGDEQREQARWAVGAPGVAPPPRALPAPSVRPEPTAATGLAPRPRRCSAATSACCRARCVATRSCALAR